MNGTTQGFAKWDQYYQETSATPIVSSAVGHSNATTMTSNMMSGTMLNHYNPCRGDSELNPKGNIGKPIRRRFRASKKTPVTLLSTNIANFRALVQQYTGCHSANPFFRMHKGPINLNFAEVSEENDFVTTSTISMFVNNYHDHKVLADQKQHYQEDQLSSEDHQQMFSFGINQNNALNSTISDLQPDMLTVDDDLVIDNTCLTW